VNRIILIAVVLALLAGAAAAQEPRFVIETIEVRNNHRVSPAIILSESLLRAGGEYSESELADANARLTRLPFLLNAEFSLERGSERGRHVLIITVHETRNFFFWLDIRPVWRVDDDRVNTVSLEAPTILDQNTSAIALGYRWFVGRRGALHVGLIGTSDNRDYTSDSGGIVVGYTQYDLFGSRAFATLNIKSNLGKPTPQFLLGVPLSLNQNLTLNYDQTDYETSRVYIGNIAETDVDSQRLLTLRWSYNDTNHPFLPTRGTILHVTPVVVWKDDVGAQFGEVGELPRRVITHSRAFGIDVGAARYWEPSDRHSISAGVELGTANVDFRADGRSGSYNSTHAIVKTGYSYSLWSREQMQRGGDSRLELKLGAIQRWRPDEPSREDDRIEVTGSWVRRSSWGMLRLGAGYAW
jgi:outer membrane protein assembly factor BamA